MICGSNLDSIPPSFTGPVFLPQWLMPEWLEGVAHPIPNKPANLTLKTGMSVTLLEQPLSQQKQTCLTETFRKQAGVQKALFPFISFCLKVNLYKFSHHFFSPDPSLTVRADITGRYSNRLYAYEPTDISLCKYSVLTHSGNILKAVTFFHLPRNNTRHYRFLPSVLAERHLTRIKINQDARLKPSEMKKMMAEPWSLKHPSVLKASIRQ